MISFQSYKFRIDKYSKCQTLILTASPPGQPEDLPGSVGRVLDHPVASIQVSENSRDKLEPMVLELNWAQLEANKFNCSTIFYLVFYLV